VGVCNQMPVEKETGTSAMHRLLIDLYPIAQDFALNVLAKCSQLDILHLASLSGLCSI
jgi:hypothetical protein